MFVMYNKTMHTRTTSQFIKNRKTFTILYYYGTELKEQETFTNTCKRRLSSYRNYMDHC